MSISKALVEDVVTGMQTEFGDFGATTLAETEIGRVENFISTGSIVVDKVLTAGVIGKPIVPFGRIVTCEGKNQSGKTTTMIQVAIEAQRFGVLPIIIDNEEKMDKPMAVDMGLDIDNTIYTSCITVEETFEKIHKLISIVLEKAPDKLMIIFWDSLGGTPTQGELDDSGGTATAARVVGEELRKAVVRLKRTQTCLWINNHIYRDPYIKFGDPYKPYGGEKPQLHATWRIRLTRAGTFKEGGTVVGSKIKVKTLKNNTSLPFQEAVGHILHGQGWSNAYTTFDLAKRKLIEQVEGGSTKASVWTTPKGEVLKWRGWAQFEKIVIPHPEFPELVSLARDAIPFGDDK